MDKKIKINFDQSTNKNQMGLIDRGIISMSCKECKEPLMDFWITMNNEDLINKNIEPMYANVLVECSLCGSSSFVKRIDGQFFPGRPEKRKGFEPLDKKMCGIDLIFKAW